MLPGVANKKGKKKKKKRSEKKSVCKCELTGQKFRMDYLAVSYG